jgi:hypothetical protein
MMPCGILCAIAFAVGLAACGQTSADSIAPDLDTRPATASSVCAERLPDEIAVPDGFKIETCTQSETMTTFRGKATAGRDVDAAFIALKSTYKSAGYTLYDNSTGHIRGVIFGGTGHQKGEIQLNPKTGFLAVSINLYPADMEQ